LQALAGWGLQSTLEVLGWEHWLLQRLAAAPYQRLVCQVLPHLLGLASPAMPTSRPAYPERQSQQKQRVPHRNRRRVPAHPPLGHWQHPL